MTPRERKIRRIAAVQDKLHQLAQWELMDCSAKEHALQERQRRIIEGFNDSNGLSALAAQTASRNLRSASVEQGALAAAKELLTARALIEARKLKQVVRASRAADRQALREQDKRLLEEIIETAAKRSHEGAQSNVTSPDR
ncbi:MAG: hypothetical protein AB1586_32885 [Pseudomonadota bacterium]|jgi:hypothetical protein